MKKIEIIPLARKKIGQRKIPEQWIIDTMNTPEQVVEGYGNRAVAHRRYRLHGKEQLLRVVYEEAAESRTVITAYLTSSAKRYWKEE